MPIMPLKKLLIITTLFIFTVSTTTSAQSWKTNFITALKNGGALVEDSRGKTILDHRSNTYFIPASTIKIATAAMVLHHLGANFRFITDFYLTKDKKLVIKGFGDPSLTSEELADIAKALRQKRIKNIRGIIIDTSYFSTNIVIDGASASSNPYDAVNGALIANFNTVYVQKFKNGRIVSAEPQTPLTNLARQRAKRMSAGKRRVNLGKSSKKGALYAGELLSEFLKLEGVKIEGSISLGTIPGNAKEIYQHQSSKPLSEIVRDLLEHSTNFSSNQLFLVIGAEKYGAPATVEKGQRALREFLSIQVGLKGFQVFEGAGLSRMNRITPQQMMALLRYFQPYKDLLPMESVFQAKTGTLRGVNTFAGYFQDRYGEEYRFVIFVNSEVPYDYKFRLAKRLYTGITGLKPPK